SDKYKVAVLSRGYKRKTEGFVLADENTRVEDLGDEPFQFFSKFHHIQVAVDADRTNGIKQLLQSDNPPEVILLDDAYQHRKVKIGKHTSELQSRENLVCRLLLEKKKKKKTHVKQSDKNNSEATRR